MKKILVIDECPETCNLIERYLGRQFVLKSVSTMKEATETIAGGGFDLILLDINLPDGDGFQLCSRIRADRDTAEVPVIIMSSRHHLNDKLTGFSLGADDYVVKPFEPLELLARVQSRLTRQSPQAGIEPEFRKGDLRISVPRQRATLTLESGTVEINLTPREFKLLYLFMKNEDLVLSRENLLDAVWGGHLDIMDRTIDRHVSSLRKKLLGREYYLKTVLGMGYRFSITPMR